jgi:murein DD-endopeptidase MepM/ murein hydrolase activator NlpD
LALRCLDALRRLWLIFTKLISLITPIFAPLGAFFLRFVFLPLYRVFFFTRLRLEKALASTRGFIFLIFTNRYTLHVIVVIVAVPAIVSQLQTKSATADVGQRSILYAIVTNGQESLVQDSEPLVQAPTQDHYLADSLQSVPSIDYDYEAVADGQTTDHGLDGSIAFQPKTDFPDTTAPTSTTPTDTVATEPTEPTPEPSKPRETVTEYRVKSGDTVATIARRFHVTVATVLWANDLTKQASIKPGDTLRIPSETGVLHVVKKNETLAKIAQLYTVSATDIADTNHVSVGASLRIGRELLIPGASPLDSSTPVAVKPASPPPTPTSPAPKPTKPDATRIAVRPDIPIARISNKAFDIYQELTGEPDDTRNVPPDKDPTTVKSTTKLLWPTQQHVINQYYGWQHTGVDLDGDYTDPIYAADDGIVEKAGWNSGGYGLQIIIDHGNGIKTRYAHSSKLLVKEGDTVKRGQVIAMVGTTGRSTGTHLHFEVYEDGKRKNPLAYIK